MTDKLIEEWEKDFDIREMKIWQFDGPQTFTRQTKQFVKEFIRELLAARDSLHLAQVRELREAIKKHRPHMTFNVNYSRKKPVIENRSFVKKAEILKAFDACRERQEGGKV